MEEARAPCLKMHCYLLKWKFLSSIRMQYWHVVLDLSYFKLATVVAKSF